MSQRGMASRPSTKLFIPDAAKGSVSRTARVITPEEVQLRETPLLLNIEHVRVKMSAPRQKQFDAYVKANIVGEMITFEQLRSVLEMVSIGDETKHGVSMNVGGSSGVVALAEFCAFVEMKKAGDKDKGLLRMGVALLFTVTLILIVAMLGMGIVAGEVRASMDALSRQIPFLLRA